MNVQRITGRFGRRLLWCTLGAMLALSPGTASAAGTTTDACTQAGVPLGAGNTCQNQTQAAVGYNGSQSQGWAYYCGGEPYVLLWRHQWYCLAQVGYCGSMDVGQPRLRRRQKAVRQSSRTRRLVDNQDVVRLGGQSVAHSSDGAAGESEPGKRRRARRPELQRLRGDARRSTATCLARPGSKECPGLVMQEHCADRNAYRQRCFGVLFFRGRPCPRLRHGSIPY